MNISAEDEDFLQNIRDEMREYDSTVQTDQNSETSNNKEKDVKPEKEKKEAFEVPEFLYKFSSTFFKKASSKDKKIFKIFGKVNKENVKMRTDRLARANSEVRNTGEVDPEMGIYSGNNALNRSFKKIDRKNSDLKLKINDEAEEEEKDKKKRKLHHR